MYILKKSPRTLGLDEPIRHESHKAPVSRRDFIAQGFRTGPAIVAGGRAAQRCSWVARRARAMCPPLEACAAARPATSRRAPARCRSSASTSPAARTCSGSEILIGVSGNPLNFLSTQGYATLGLPGNMTPGFGQRGQPD